MTKWEQHFDKLQHGFTFDQNNPDVIDISENENCNKKLIQNDTGPSQNKSHDRYKTHSLDECAENMVKELRAIPKHLDNACPFSFFSDFLFPFSCASHFPPGFCFSFCMRAAFSPRMFFQIIFASDIPSAFMFFRFRFSPPGFFWFPVFPPVFIHFPVESISFISRRDFLQIFNANPTRFFLFFFNFIFSSSINHQPFRPPIAFIYISPLINAIICHRPFRHGQIFIIFGRC